MTIRSLLAWIEESDAVVIGCFVGEDAASRAPARRACESAEEARRWVEEQAADFGLTVKWLDDRPYL